MRRGIEQVRTGGVDRRWLGRVKVHPDSLQYNAISVMPDLGSSGNEQVKAAVSVCCPSRRPCTSSLRVW